jgi:hypothetical protein
VFVSDSPVSEIPGGCMALSRTYDLLFPSGEDAVGKLSVEAESASFSRKPGFWVNRFDGGGDWLEAQSEDGRFLTSIKTSGSYCLISDQIAPEIISSQLINADKSGMILSFSDNASGIDPASIRIRCAGNTLETDVVRSGKDEVEIILPGRELLREEFEVEVADRAGNVASKIFAQSLVGETRIFETSVFPNPCNGKAFFRVRLEGTAAKNPANSGFVKIYDSSGKKVGSLVLTSDATGDLNARWDGKNSSGKVVANGIYFYKTKIFAGGKELKKSGKLAVLK